GASRRSCARSKRTTTSCVRASRGERTRTGAIRSTSSDVVSCQAEAQASIVGPQSFDSGGFEDDDVSTFGGDAVASRNGRWLDVCKRQAPRLHLCSFV